MSRVPSLCRTIPDSIIPPVISRRGVCWAVLFLLGAAAVSSFAADSKPVRLRNETFSPPAKSLVAQTSLAQPPLTGLRLLQFTGPLEPVWRDTLRTNGVELLQSVPTDTFVARMNGVSSSRLLAFPFVQWVGDYRPAHKVFRGIRLPALNATAPVRILLPPKPSNADLAGLRQILKSVRVASASRWGVVLEANVTGRQLARLASSDAVLWIENTPRPTLFDEVSSKIVGGSTGTPGTRSAVNQLGFDGAGVTVAVADSGLDDGIAATMHPDLFGRTPAFFFYGALDSAADEHSHGTHCSGIIAGNGSLGEADDKGFLYGLGVAPGASIVAQRIFDAVGGYEPPATMGILTRDAVRAGAVIGSNSWGDDTQGRYDLSAREFDGLVRDADAETPGDQPYILEFSAGNAGPGNQTIGSPAVAKNVIATGASENDRPDLLVYVDSINAMADFSSRGPAEDGRIKPDVTAPGTWIASLQSSSATDQYAWGAISANYQYQGGTSQAGPHVSGAAAVFVQYYRETHNGATPSPALVKAALIDSAQDMDDFWGTGPTPNQDEGWGRVDLTKLIGSPRRHDFVEETNTLVQGAVWEHRVTVATSREPLKITLAYTDVPGFPAVIPALVNDLDLEVVTPNGEILLGNVFDHGESVPGGSPDRINNVEAVRLSQPPAGEYVVRIRAHAVIDDARGDTAAVDQDFALVASGDLPLPGVGVVFMDRGAYRAPDTIRLKLIDPDLAGHPTASVLISSSIETAGESITLVASGTGGVFTNSIATVLGAAAADGRLQIADGGAITATYQDASPALARTAHAVADLTAPVIGAVGTDAQFGRTAVHWTTDEPATSLVVFGPAGTVTQLVTNRGFATSHSVPLSKLERNQSYQFYVVSSDEAGNVRTNDNAGQLFSLIALGAPPVLVVNSYADSGGLDDTAPIPVSEYTDALRQSGVGFDVWNVADQGRSPTAADLSPFRCVLWRVNDSFWVPNNSLNLSERTAITNYLNTGGSFMMASMEILSRLTNDGAFNFVTNVFKVRSFNADVKLPQVEGVDGDPVSSGMLLSLDYTRFPSFEALDLGPDVSDTVHAYTNAAPVFLDTASFQAGGVRFPRVGQDSTNRTLLMSFPLEAISMTDPAPDNRSTVLGRALSFLVPGLNGIGNLALDRGAYTLPSQMIVEVGDEDLAGTGSVTVKAFSNTLTNGVAVVLNETVRKGLFRGTVPIDPSSSTPSGNRLRAAAGDDLWIEYADASAGQTVRARAVVDVAPPVITGRNIQVEYGEAVIGWNTDEAADALVQYGESTFLGRTEYTADFDVVHTLSLSGLAPDRLYYYQLVSRDEAGNTVVDNNGGRLYTLRTLKPIVPPWFDNLENSATNWTVVDGEGSSKSWELGTPSGPLGVTAYSGSKVWGINLMGGSYDQSHSMLIAPGIDLNGLAASTLRFQTAYGFPAYSSDIGEIAQVYITTNSGAAWILLEDLSANPSSTGWEEHVLSLTPYVGSVVRIAFYYELLSFSPENRPGWLVDDVRIETVDAKTGSVIRVTNNLSQATFTLAGPTNLVGAGYSVGFTNVPPGDYTLTWNTVTNYLTPPPATQTLVQDGTATFSANYVFPDSNTNGISDLWEMAHFGKVDPVYPPSRDSDHDGFSDRDEFLAGTDPKDPASFLSLDAEPMASANGVVLRWSQTIGLSYRLQQTTDLATWNILRDWLRATNTVGELELPSASQSNSGIIRLQVRP
jgi:subtilisin family serine protease